MELTAKEIVTDQPLEISVVVPVVERHNNLMEVYQAYSREIEKITKDFEFIFVVDGNMHKAYAEIESFARENPRIELIKFSRNLGEAYALSVGFAKARGRYIFTLASYFQVEPEEIKKLYLALKDDTCDIVISRRSRDKDSFFNRLQNLLFHKALKIFTGSDFKDISCGLRGMKREVIEKFDIYGDLHRYIPIIAEFHGISVRELSVKQRKEDRKARVYSLRTYINRVIDLTTLFFLLRFTFRPMRFFGLIGSILIISGLAYNLYLMYHRFFTRGFELADKPSLFLASLLIVIGIQVFAVGLIGEIIIYTRSKKAKYFNVKEIIE